MSSTRRRRRQTLPALLIGPILIALLAMWGPVRALARALVRSAAPGSVVRKPGAVVLATLIMLASLVWGVTPPASAAIGYTGHIGNALNSGCATPWSVVTASEDNFVDQSEPSSVQTPSNSNVHTRSAVGNVDRAFVKFPMPAVPSGCELDMAWMDLEVQTYTEWPNDPGGSCSILVVGIGDHLEQPAGCHRHGHLCPERRR